MRLLGLSIALLGGVDVDCVCVGIMLTVLSVESFRVLQQVGYRPERGYMRVYLSAYGILLLCTQCVSVAMYLLGAPVWAAVCLYAVVGLPCLFVRRKCPIVYTPRLIRMFAVQLVLCVVLSLWLAWFVVALLPCLALVAWTAMLPVERKIAIRYQKSATKRLVESGVKVIAVTGSYGKTTTKTMLAELLGGKAVCPTGSCNTPLGIAKFINGCDLSKYKYVVLEYGARRRGDIAELCRLYPPDYGVITGICPQHLSTFGSLDNIVAEKTSLGSALPSVGICVINGADEVLRKATFDGKCKVLASGSNVSVRTIKTEIDGQTLEVDTAQESATVKLPQIADYAANIFAMCAEMCLSLGMSLDEITANTKFITQCPHRMQVLRRGELCIVDDSYNASIDSVSAACSTIGKLGGTKIAIAQGIVECGNKRKQLNIECGRMLGETFDIVVVVGKNSSLLQRGCEESSTPTIKARNVQQATLLAVERICGKGILYFQNDLPDAPTM